jgi:subtilase family serine protease
MRRSVPRALRRPGLSLTAVAGIVLAGAGIATAPAASARPAAPVTHPPAAVHVCAPSTTDRQMACGLLKVVGGATASRAAGTAPHTTPAGLGPADLRSAYALPANGGAGSTLAVVDAYDDPDAAADMTAYRAQFGLTACTVTSGCFRKVSQTGSTTALPTADEGWAQEESLDLDMASAVAPAAHLILVEAKSASTADLGAAVNEAVALGATSVDASWGGQESSSDLASDNSYFDHPGVAISAASGDSGFGVEYPAASRYVTAVGATTLTKAAATKRGWTESAWSSGGCSAYEPKPAWQKDTGCTKRTLVDVAAVGDPASGVAVYDTYDEAGWEVFGGSSVSAAVIAGVYADAGVPSAGSWPASFPYAHPGNLYDITTGPGAGPGYDEATGLGTPDGVAAFKG